MPMKPFAAAITLTLALAGSHGITGAQAQGAQTKPEEAAGACTITSRGNGQKTCMNRVPQAACAANAREQRTEFDWKAWTDCP
ncbi:hypothetical protein [Methylorubrum sp. SB2]|uniref:hypothetical protein n=1 Tax=Methylorubrum subtropicum TaxID=3138812 RepID=UPI00313F0DD3